MSISTSKEATVRGLADNLMMWPDTVEEASELDPPSGWGWGMIDGKIVLMSNDMDPRLGIDKGDIIDEREWMHSLCFEDDPDPEFVKTDGVTPWGASVHDAMADDQDACDAAFRRLVDDPGSHYRHSFRAKVTLEDLQRGYVEINLDPYRIGKIYDLGGGPREHVVKKGLRGTAKGMTERELIGELRCSINRWEQMLDEEEGL